MPFLADPCVYLQGCSFTIPHPHTSPSLDPLMHFGHLLLVNLKISTSPLMCCNPIGPHRCCHLCLCHLWCPRYTLLSRRSPHMTQGDINIAPYPLDGRDNLTELCAVSPFSTLGLICFDTGRVSLSKVVQAGTPTHSHSMPPHLRSAVDDCGNHGMRHGCVARLLPSCLSSTQPVTMRMTLAHATTAKQRCLRSLDYRAAPRIQCRLPHAF
ncbi:hypothetical protein BJV78DRAFT_912311 [Lactifluus subvellereus]|nr:hypothetical protein BJV78DRAFT_912311 [Lactifluus subvellereus]